MHEHWHRSTRRLPQTTLTSHVARQHHELSTSRLAQASAMAFIVLVLVLAVIVVAFRAMERNRAAERSAAR